MVISISVVAVVLTEPRGLCICVLIIEVWTPDRDITKGHQRSGQGSLGSCCSLNCALYDVTALAQPCAWVGRGWAGLAPWVMCQHLARTGRPSKPIPFSEGDFPHLDPPEIWVITSQQVEPGGRQGKGGDWWGEVYF